MSCQHAAMSTELSRGQKVVECPHSQCVYLHSPSSGLPSETTIFRELVYQSFSQAPPGYLCHFGDPLWKCCQDYAFFRHKEIQFSNSSLKTNQSPKSGRKDNSLLNLGIILKTNDFTGSKKGRSCGPSLLSNSMLIKYGYEVKMPNHFIFLFVTYRNQI